MTDVIVNVAEGKPLYTVLADVIALVADGITTLYMADAIAIMAGVMTTLWYGWC